MGLFKTKIAPNGTVLYDGTEPNTITINNGGTGYTVNDLISINGFALGGEICICRVSTISGSAVTAVVILNTGYGYTVANGYTTTKITGNGSGLILNITVLKTRNVNFAHAKYGLDTNAGTRISPFKTASKTITNIYLNSVFSGKSTENLGIAGLNGSQLIFENESYITGDSAGASGYSQTRYNQKCLNATSYFGRMLIDSVILGVINSPTFNNSSNVFINEFRQTTAVNSVSLYNHTILIFKNYASIYVANCINFIVVNEFDLSRFGNQTVGYYKFSYSLFRKSLIWKWNGSVISITYGIASTFLEDVWNGLNNYCINTLTSTNQTYMRLMIGNSFGECLLFNSTCKIIDDSIYPIFNRYDGANIIDYTLNTKSDNEALFMGDVTHTNYVGCYRPNIAGQATLIPMEWGDIINVNADNTDDIVAGDMLSINANNVIFLNEESEQLRNRVRTNIIKYPRNAASFGAQSLTDISIDGNYIFGKYRPLDIYNQPQHTLEVIPYDNLTTPSATMGKFSVSLNGETRLYYSLETGKYITFNDLADYGIATDVNLTYFGDYIVTTADNESSMLSFLTTIISTLPILSNYVKLELNINYIE